jgi:hypothetical protein
VTFSDAQWNTNDYMKREHSLVKPYQGNISWICDDKMAIKSINLSTALIQSNYKKSPIPRELHVLWQNDEIKKYCL